MRCVTCTSELGDAMARGQPCWTCTACQGVWVGHRELEGVFEPHPPPFGAPAMWTETTRTCPECGETMGHVGLAGVPVERCLQHGVWFDRAELELAVSEAATRRDAPMRTLPSSKPPDQNVMGLVVTLCAELLAALL
jgi:Zn-finger nucleic acid-binding protein